MAKFCLVFVAFHGVSHFTPMIQLAKQLTETGNNGFSITVLIVNPPLSQAAASFITSISSSGLDIEFKELLPSVNPQSFIRGPEDITDRFIERHEDIKKAISTILSAGTSVKALILDIFATSLIDIADELNIPAYIYFATNAFMLGLMMHLPALHERISIDFEEMEGDVEVPGLPPIPARCMPTPVMNRKSRGYSCFVEHGRRFLQAQGIIINTFVELEQEHIKAIQEGHVVEQRQRVPPLYPVGPILALQSNTDAQNEEMKHCLKWLDEQPLKSVVFLCFGSMRPLSAQMMQQIAIGLERSGVRFLWSVKIVPTADASLDDFLPAGFSLRTKDRGIVLPGWVSQKDVLAHSAVGAFVTHCGWNSVTESLWFGVPMIAWPIYAEQHLNAYEMAIEAGVAVELKMERKNDNFVEAEEFERGIRCLMDDISEKGKLVRAKVDEMNAACNKALEKDGTSHAALTSLVAQLGSGKRTC